MLLTSSDRDPVTGDAESESRIGTVDRLDAGTRELGECVEAELAAMPYPSYLRRMYGIHAAVEQALASARSLDTVIADAKLRNNKGALIALDLLAFACDRRELATLPRLPIAVPADDLPLAIGWMYILESTARAARRIRATRDHGTYLDCYGRGADRRWREFAQSVDSYAVRSGGADRIVGAAVDGLAQLHRWLR